jgi:hypothetical protein
MTTVLIHHRVADYETWKPEYDRVGGGPLGADIRSHRIWRGQDDPQLVIIEETYESREIAEATLNNPALPAELVKAGVDMSSVRIDYVDEVESGTLWAHHESARGST